MNQSVSIDKKVIFRCLIQQYYENCLVCLNSMFLMNPVSETQQWATIHMWPMSENVFP